MVLDFGFVETVPARRALEPWRGIGGEKEMSYYSFVPSCDGSRCVGFMDALELIL